MCKRERFLVWLPRSLVIRYTLEQPASRFHFLVEFIEQALTLCHSRCLRCCKKSTNEETHSRRTESCSYENGPGPDRARPRCPLLRNQSRTLFRRVRISFLSTGQSLLARTLRSWIHQSLVEA